MKINMCPVQFLLAGKQKPCRETNDKTSSSGKMNRTMTFIIISTISCPMPGSAISVRGTIIASSTNSRNDYHKERIFRKYYSFLLNKETSYI